ncbi:hypothetical protein C8Q79DRAFT_1120947 [Trametes meyenii]|nr:hypothetical protein C8Q79DRAFT_1120947 [Trametes meyenii]
MSSTSSDSEEAKQLALLRAVLQFVPWRIPENDVERSDAWPKPPYGNWPIDLAAVQEELAELEKKGLQDRELLASRKTEIWVFTANTLSPASVGYWELGLFLEVSYNLRPDDDPQKVPGLINNKWTGGAQEMKLRSGYIGRGNFLCAGMLPKVPLRHDFIANTFFDYMPVAEVLTIAITSCLFSYCRRPNQAQYDWMKRIMGEPTWFVYPFTMEQFIHEDVYV